MMKALLLIGLLLLSTMAACWCLPGKGHDAPPSKPVDRPYDPLY
jgi:hypothetical protein